ncbi:MAG: hypothetical protein ILNGONEN_00327 [Syntrophorhabdaceae bacterium]|nr:hypothetical protein [Syntrophorhabdaceae bacterium]
MKEKIKVSTGKIKGSDGKPISIEIEYDFGDDLADAIKKYGEAAVFDLYKAAASIRVQNVARSALLNGKAPEEAVALAENYVLGTSFSKGPRDPVRTAVSAVSKMSPEEEKEFILKLKERAKALGIKLN